MATALTGVVDTVPIAILYWKLKVLWGGACSMAEDEDGIVEGNYRIWYLVS